jgi:hypothetical protein
MRARRLTESAGSAILSVTPGGKPPPFFDLTMKLVWLALGLGMLSAAAVAADEVEAVATKFSNVRAPNGANGSWLEAEITLNVRPAAGSPGQMVSRVRVAALFGFELPALAGAERRTEYYRAEAECVALDSGHNDVRFYLPPELVKRDQMHGEPKFWLIDVTAGGRAQVPGRGSASTSLATAEAKKSFQSRASTAAAANDGLLLPQYLTIFAGEYPRATPSFVRREAR